MKILLNKIMVSKLVAALKRWLYRLMKKYFFNELMQEIKTTKVEGTFFTAQYESGRVDNKLFHSIEAFEKHYNSMFNGEWNSLDKYFWWHDGKVKNIVKLKVV